MKSKYSFFVVILLVSLAFSVNLYAGFQEEAGNPEGIRMADETQVDSTDYDFSAVMDSILGRSQIMEEKDTILRMAVVLSDIYSNKDMEFSRGVLLGMKESALPDYSVSLKIINGEIPYDSLYRELESFEPHFMISTYEKNHPTALGTYSTIKGAKLMTVFDAKNDNFVKFPWAYQALVPVEVFNESITRYFMDYHGGDNLVMVGDPDLNDLMLRNLVVAWPEEKFMILTKSELPRLLLEENENYIFLPVSLNSSDVKSVLSEINKLSEKYPASDIKILGRPNWISFSDLNSMVNGMDVYIPAKCYFDPSSDSGKRLISSYKEAYGHSPIKSYPTYAVMGYDTAKYFLPYFLKELRDENPRWLPDNMVQSYFDMKKNGLNGYYNRGSLMIHYRPWGAVQRLTLN